ncbi:lipopolysaccharide biosynthesis protein [Crystallibacter degradans]|uniref:lipopolysaccharide biosynthesis protein n=1 Tax=Crystallibacter degradans TaxID=2726743 RepID=UPI00147591CC|nr:lipopolysaccharide biosynthesis protein [Arthrobacter sp. SF27]NMR28216.1 lipopolysaccharide biosynthesis protein [Arthrobacter sp. SF27]
MSIRQGHEGTTDRSAGPGIGASSAFGWSLLNTVVSRFGTLGIGIILARVLGPESFGTFAVALVALMAVLSFNELGVSLAIVRWRGDPERIAPTVTTVSVFCSLVFSAAAFLVAPTFASAMGDPEATDVVRLLIVNVLINGIVATPAALLQRNFQERTRMGIDQVNVWVGAVLSVVLALAGMGAMALAVGRAAGGLTSAIMFLKASPLPYRFGLERAHLGPLLRFGWPLAGSSIVVFAVGYADQLAAGSILGATALGLYVLAFNLASWPVSIVSQPLRRVAPAVFSKLQDQPDQMHASVISIVGVLAAAAVPTFLTLAGAAVPLVGFVYGEVWLPAAAALSWLVVSALCRIFYELVYDYLVVLGRTGIVFAIQAGSLIVLVPALVAGAFWGGIAGLAAAQALVSAAVVLPLYLWQLRQTGILLRSIASGLWLPIMAGLITGGGSFILATNLESPLLALLLAGFLALVVSAVLLYRRREQVKLLRQIGLAEKTVERS